MNFAAPQRGGLQDLIRADPSCRCQLLSARRTQAGWREVALDRPPALSHFRHHFSDTSRTSRNNPPPSPRPKNDDHPDSKRSHTNPGIVHGNRAALQVAVFERIAPTTEGACFRQLIRLNAKAPATHELRRRDRPSTQLSRLSPATRLTCTQFICVVESAVF